MLTAAGGLYKFSALHDEFEIMLKEGCDSPYLLSILVDFYEEFVEHDPSTGKNHGLRAVEVHCLYELFFLIHDYDRLFYKYIIPYVI